MSSRTNLYINLNNNDDANKVASIMKRMAAERIPDYPTEIDKFVAGIEVEEKTVKIEENYSLMSNTFCEWIPQIMMEIARGDFGAITMDAWYVSENCSYEAEFSGRVFKNHKFRMSFNEHD